MTACALEAAADYTFVRNNLCIGGPAGGQRFGGYCCRSRRCRLSGFAWPALQLTITTPSGRSRPRSRGTSARNDFRASRNCVAARMKCTRVKVDMSVFNNVAFPIQPVPERAVADLRPRAGTVVVDAALRLPNINDDFRGAGPDIGAYEAGEPLPHYGPRLRGVDEETPGNR